MFVRIGFRKAGIIIENTGDAKDYGKKLEDAGFVPIVRLKGGESLPADYVPEPGDVAVMQPYPGGSVEGHMQAFTGAIWASDFRQRDMKDGQQGFWAGPGYRSRQPPSVIYRRQKSQDQPALIAAK